MFRRLFVQWLPFQVLLLVLAVLTVVLSNKIGSLPPLGSLLSPFTGFWQNKPLNLKSRNETFNWPELKQAVTVSWDDYGVPHIFAQSAHDVFLVQGYVQARHRLFQLEITSRAGQARLSEILGDKTLPTDTFFVKLGMRKAVKSAYQKFMADSETREAMESFSKGVNLWIDSLNFNSYPLEYKLLDATPSRWTPKATTAIFMVMAFRLAGRSYDLFLTRHVQKHGFEKIHRLFPDFHSDDLTVSYPRGENSIPTKRKPFPFFKKNPPFIAQVNLDIADQYVQPFATNGSNNWAYSSKKSIDGETYLANDTHLNFSLPGIFYEQQLATPEFNIYGASIIGSPGLQIGFHEKFGWAVTNGNTDVLDWYEIEFDKEHGDKYLFENQWLEIKKSKEIILSRSGQQIVVNIESTKSGQVYHRDKKLGLTLRWMGLQNKNELKTFLQLTKSKDHDDCVKATEHYHVPIQNLICADVNQLSIHHMGTAPLRTQPTGSLVKDGRVKDPDWQQYIPSDKMPKSINPDNGFVLSANQRVADRKYKHYLSWDFEESYRAKEIEKSLLQTAGHVSLDHFKKLQNRTFSPLAAELVPLLLSSLRQSELSDIQRQTLKEFESWNFEMNAESWKPSVFQYWWENLEESLYHESLGLQKKNAYPRVQRTSQLLRDLLERIDKENLKSFWFLSETLQREELRELLSDKVTESFQKSWSHLEDNFGPSFSSWLWRTVRPTTVPHILKIPGLSELNVPKSGGRFTVDVNTGSAGAVWRQVVKFGKEFEAYTNYPGGASGNPFSKSYSSNVSGWAQGEYRKVHFLNTPLSFEGEEQ